MGTNTNYMRKKNEKCSVEIREYVENKVKYITAKLERHFEFSDTGIIWWRRSGSFHISVLMSKCWRQSQGRPVGEKKKRKRNIILSKTGLIVWQNRSHMQLCASSCKFGQNTQENREIDSHSTESRFFFLNWYFHHRGQYVLPKLELANHQMSGVLDSSSVVELSVHLHGSPEI